MTKRPVYQWSWGERGSCPTSTHPKHEHQGDAVSRRIERTTHTVNGQTRTIDHYVDHVRCAHCGAAHDQEWIPA